MEVAPQTNEQQLQFLYRLVEGTCSSSLAAYTALQAGLPEQVVTRGYQVRTLTLLVIGAKKVKCAYAHRYTTRIVSVDLLCPSVQSPSTRNMSGASATCQDIRSFYLLRAFTCDVSADWTRLLIRLLRRCRSYWRMLRRALTASASTLRATLVFFIND